MTSRVFVSYRTSDGADKATALARELNVVFGDEQVFLDKEDLPAGRPWREAIGAALDNKPILLLLITPQALGPRLHDANDPLRQEVASALEFGAHVIPLLCDGVERLPEAHEWPEAMHPLSERTWRRLRAYDWRTDVDRLVADLQALGVQRTTAPPRRRGMQIALACGAAALAVGGALMSLRSGEPVDPSSLGGDWMLRVAAPANEAGSRLDAVTLHVTHSGEDVKLHSEPIDIRRDPAWAGFAQQWSERFGNKLEHVVWRGAGRALRAPGSMPAIDVSLRVETPAGSEPIETGSLFAELSADGQRMSGRLWMNGEQAERSLEMARDTR
jgi:hypothetical protein